MDNHGPESEEDFLDPLIGTMVGRFRVEKKIGQGGMGAVYALLQPAIHKRMALKLLHEHYASRQDIVQRFFGEARAVNLIGHPNIVDISDFSHLPDGRPFIMMEFLEGQSLEDYLEERGALSAEETLTLLKQMCSALGAAHAKGIYHRDIKPENFFITKSHDGSNFLKVLDFGIAKLKDERGDPAHRMQTGAGIVLGTPTYMSPEQAEGNTEDADHRTDIYSLGIVLYQMLTGTAPFVGRTFAELIIKHVQQPPPSLHDTRPDLPAAWDQLLKKALAKKPADRYQSMAALYEDAAAALGSGVYATPARTEQAIAKPKKALWLALPAIVALASFAFFISQDGEETPEATGPILTSSAASPGATAAGANAPGLQGDAGPASTQPTQAAPADAAPANHVPPDAASAIAADARIASENTNTSNNNKKNRGTGTLRVSANPWAKVFIDGKDVGTTPLKRTLPAGTHRIRLMNTASGATKNRRVKIKKDEISTIFEKW